MQTIINQINFNEDGLVPIITQDNTTKKVLMLAYANKEAIQKSIVTKKAHYYSRSRQSLWCKGETSGNYQEIVDIAIDCDNDTLLFLVIQHGLQAACHTGHENCFYRSIINNEIVHNKTNLIFNPNEVY